MKVYPIWALKIKIERSCLFVDGLFMQRGLTSVQLLLECFLHVIHPLLQKFERLFLLGKLVTHLVVRLTKLLDQVGALQALRETLLRLSEEKNK